MMEILLAWEQWKGPMQDFYRAIGVSAKGMASIIGRAKKLRREGHFPAEDFKKIKITDPGSSLDGLFYDGTGLVIVAKRMERGLFSRINPMHRNEVVLTAAEFALFFEGANFEKRFIDSPREIKKSFSIDQQLPTAGM